MTRITSTVAHEPQPSTEDIPAARRHNLPADLTSFIGRRQELEELPRLLATTRLLSLLGSGGVGKTRVAVRLASNLVGEFPDGVWMADLGALSAPALILETIALVLGLRESPHRSPRSVLLDYLRPRTALLVLDTCEHLVAACAEVVEVLLHEAPGLRIVATSREALGVQGEVVYRVPPLSVPEESAAINQELESDAARLFLDRASAADPAFRPSPLGAAAVARICRRLDGSPLRSSSLPRASRCWLPRKSRRGWRIGFACSPVRGPPSLASGPSKPQWSGAFSCSRSASVCC